jgi:hypothetical protein
VLWGVEVRFTCAQANNVLASRFNSAALLVTARVGDGLMVFTRSETYVHGSILLIGLKIKAHYISLKTCKAFKNTDFLQKNIKKFNFELGSVDIYCS